MIYYEGPLKGSASKERVFDILTEHADSTAQAFDSTKSSMRKMMDISSEVESMREAYDLLTSPQKLKETLRKNTGDLVEATGAEAANISNQAIKALDESGRKGSLSLALFGIDLENPNRLSPTVSDAIQKAYAYQAGLAGDKIVQSVKSIGKPKPGETMETRVQKKTDAKVIPIKDAIIRMRDNTVIKPANDDIGVFVKEDKLKQGTAANTAEGGSQGIKLLVEQMASDRAAFAKSINAIVDALRDQELITKINTETIATKVAYGKLPGNVYFKLASPFDKTG